MNKKMSVVMIAILLSVSWGITAFAQCCGGGLIVNEPEDVQVELKPQTKCPVMDGNDINKNLFIDINGKRIYVCCKGCIDAVKKSPEKYLAKIEKNGETAETVLCGKCGEIKGSKGCCDKNAKRCSKCDAIKGSKGCCKLPTKEANSIICLKCGKIKGTDICCKKK